MELNTAFISGSPNGITIEPFDGSSIWEAATVVAEAMLNNPIHLQVFRKNDEEARMMQVKLFAKVLALPSCNIIVAKQQERIVGLMNYYLPGSCQLSAFGTLALLPGLLPVLGKRLPAVLKWKSAWAKQDPKQPHLHFGPLAVLPAMQQRGIGSRLLEGFCHFADAQRQDSYLETDKEENLSLYEKFGFKVIQQDSVCGVTNWFMWRRTHRT